MKVPSSQAVPGASRRHALGLGLLLTGGAALARVSPSSDPLAPLDLDQMVDQLRPLARRTAENPGVDDLPYVLHAASLLARLQLPSEAAPTASRPIRFETLVFHRPLLIYAIRMAPGARFDLHDHLDYSGVLRVLEGSIEATHYEFADFSRREDERVELVETSRLRLGQGAMATLGRQRDNLHEVVAGPHGAYLVDLFTHDHSRSRSREFRLEPEAEVSAPGRVLATRTG